VVSKRPSIVTSELLLRCRYDTCVMSEQHDHALALDTTTSFQQACPTHAYSWLSIPCREGCLRRQLSAVHCGYYSLPKMMTT
jgi:hypothetical protein